MLFVLVCSVGEMHIWNMMVNVILLTVLKHKNTVICLQIFRKHVKFSENNATGSYSTLKCVFHVRMSVFVLVRVTPPTASLTNSI